MAGKAWQQEQEAERFYFIHTQEGRGGEGGGERVQEVAYFNKAPPPKGCITSLNRTVPLTRNQMFKLKSYRVLYFCQSSYNKHHLVW